MLYEEIIVFENVKNDVLNGPENALELDLSSYELHSICNLDRFGTGLKQLDLSCNKITSLNSNAFTNLENLGELYLQKNH